MRPLKAIYKFLSMKGRKNQQQDKQAQTTESNAKIQGSQQQDKQAKTTKEPKPNIPAKPPAKRVLITYGIFSLLFIVLAAAAWFYKGADLFPQGYFSLETIMANINVKPKEDDKNIVVPEEQPSKEPEPNLIADPELVNELQDKVERLKEEMLQMDNELNVVRIKRYMASAQYLIETRSTPEKALSLLQSARTDIEIHRHTSDVEMNALTQDIDRQIARLQQYISYSPRRALRLLNPLIDHLHTKQETTPKLQTEARADADPADESWVNGWLDRIYAAGRNLIKIEHSEHQYVENNYLLFKLLIAARSAVLLNDQEQFNIALKDALRLIEMMPNPPISKEQIESILSLEIYWQLPAVQQ